MSSLNLTIDIANNNSGDTITLNLSGGSVSSIVWGDGNTNTNTSHTYLNDGVYNININGSGITSTGGQSIISPIIYLTECTSFGEIGLTNLTNIFSDALLLTVVPSTLPTMSIITNMSQMFFTSFGTSVFNGDISGWDVSNVTNMSGMLLGATLFNQDISSWNVSNVNDMSEMLDGTNLSTTNYNNILNNWSQLSLLSGVYFGVQGLTYTSAGLNGRNILVNTYNWNISGDTYQPSPPVPCFNEGTQILCLNKDKIEEYINIENIRPGDLVKTYKHDYLRVDSIGTRKIYNPSNNMRSKDRLYICTAKNYPDVLSDLIMTGCHSILVDKLSDDQIKKTKEISGKIYITDDKYRLIACIDDRSDVYTKEGMYNIWHIALENESYYNNYGIYANGLLVESTSKRYLRELSGMTLME
jgi:surface protein